MGKSEDAGGQDEEGQQGQKGSGQKGKTALKKGSTTLGQEAEQARKELGRSALGLFLSGLLAGFAIGTSLLVMAVVLTLVEGVFPEPFVHFLEANAYTVGFIIVILGHVDLFTEYTTMAVLPVLSGKESVLRLARLWGLVYVSNLVAAAGFAGLASVLGPALGAVEPHVFGELAQGLTDHEGWVILLSGILAGWLMGLLSWLVSAGRDTTSQIFFVWMIAFTLSFAELHHCITGTTEVLSGVFTQKDLTWGDYGHFLGWATLGNAIGSVIFAVLIHYSEVIGEASGSRR